METLFELAARKKFRFNTEKGKVATEDLWDMPLESRNGYNLDLLAVSLSNQLEERKSFVVSRKSEDAITKAKLDIVVHVINTKVAEAKAKDEAAVRKDKKQKILGILKDKQDEKLKGMSEEDLMKELDSL